MRDRKDDQTHRRVAAAKLGRKLAPQEVADHVDGDKTHNTPANVRSMNRGPHTTMHNKQRELGKLRASLRMVNERKRLY